MPNHGIDEIDETCCCRPEHESASTRVTSLKMPREWNQTEHETEEGEGRKERVSGIIREHFGESEEDENHEMKRKLASKGLQSLRVCSQITLHSSVDIHCYGHFVLLSTDLISVNV
jgi:hypothetical protein